MQPYRSRFFLNRWTKAYSTLVVVPDASEAQPSKQVVAAERSRKKPTEAGRGRILRTATSSFEMAWLATLLVFQTRTTLSVDDATSSTNDADCQNGSERQLWRRERSTGTMTGLGVAMDQCRVLLPGRAGMRFAQRAHSEADGEYILVSSDDVSPSVGAVRLSKRAVCQRCTSWRAFFSDGKLREMLWSVSAFSGQLTLRMASAAKSGIDILLSLPPSYRGRRGGLLRASSDDVPDASRSQFVLAVSSGRRAADGEPSAGSLPSRAARALQMPRRPSEASARTPVRRG